MNVIHYNEKKKNALIIGEKVRNGYYTLKVLDEILKESEK